MQRGGHAGVGRPVRALLEEERPLQQRSLAARVAQGPADVAEVAERGGHLTLFFHGKCSEVSSWRTTQFVSLVDQTDS